ncbi:MAG TPA: TetR/AcrR family transcriptional regulator [Spongiibacteraceae bacterium]|nr:TetR/AcrR family transcriptional regulator [Spongiibacteraceae bacterium]
MAATTPKKFVRLAREQRVGAILSAALEVFAERGYEAAAVSEIAERAGVVEGTVYKYFESKRALLLMVMEQWYEGMVDDYTRDLAGIVGSRQRLRFIIWRHLRTIIDNPQLCRLLFREVRSELDYYDLDLHGSIRRYSKFIMDIVEEGVRANEFRSDVPLPLLRDMVFGCIEHRTWNYISGRGELDIDETVDQIMSILCSGIAQPQAGGEQAQSDSDLRAETKRLSALVTRLEKLLEQPESKIEGLR